MSVKWVRLMHTQTAVTLTCSILLYMVNSMTCSRHIYSNQRHLKFTVVHNCCKCERIFRTNVTPLVSLEAGLRFRVIDLSQLHFWSGSKDQTAYTYIDLVFKPQLLQHRSPTSTELQSINGESSRACASLGSKENHVQGSYIHSKYGHIGILKDTSESSGENIPEMMRSCCHSFVEAD